MEFRATRHAGWYPDPKNGGQSRYFDGRSWTAYVAHGAVERDMKSPTGAMPPVARKVTVSNAAVWVLAFVPLLAGALQILARLRLNEISVALAAGALVTAIAIGLALYDSVTIRRAGHRVSYWWAWFLPVVHLVKRTRRATGGWAVVAIFCATSALSLASTVAVFAYMGVELDSSRLEADIAQWLAENDAPGVVVTCPDRMNVRVGNTAVCELSDGTATANAVVTVKDWSGHLSWLVDPKSVH